MEELNSLQTNTIALCLLIIQIQESQYIGLSIWWDIFVHTENRSLTFEFRLWYLDKSVWDFIEISAETPCGDLYCKKKKKNGWLNLKKVTRLPYYTKKIALINRNSKHYVIWTTWIIINIYIYYIFLKYSAGEKSENQKIFPFASHGCLI